MKLSRSSGILLHPTSLPGRFGIGELGIEAFNFADFLADTGQSFWQILPLHPTGYGNSPYMSFSAFAGNPFLISLEKLLENDLLDSIDLENLPPFPNERIDYEMVLRFKMPLFKKAFQRFKSKSNLTVRSLRFFAIKILSGLMITLYLWSLRKCMTRKFGPNGKKVQLKENLRQLKSGDINTLIKLIFISIFSISFFNNGSL